jgi:nitrite reductase (NO-forming)
MRKVTLFIALGTMGFALVMNSCSSGGEQKAAKQTETLAQAQPEQPAATDDKAAMMARGEQLYKEKCLACHQANGQGIANVFPNLVGSEFLLKQTKLAVSQVLNGSLKVAANRTVKYPAPMPPQVTTKEDAVAVINFVMNNFGNNGGYITLDDVKDVEIMPQ